MTNIHLMIYLDEILIIAGTLQDLILHWDAVIYFLQNVGFLLNSKKFFLEPSQTIEFLGVTNASTKMDISLVVVVVQELTFGFYEK